VSENKRGRRSHRQALDSERRVRIDQRGTRRKRGGEPSETFPVLERSIELGENPRDRLPSKRFARFSPGKHCDFE